MIVQTYLYDDTRSADDVNRVVSALCVIRERVHQPASIRQELQTQTHTNNSSAGQQPCLLSRRGRNKFNTVIIDEATNTHTHTHTHHTHTHKHTPHTHTHTPHTTTHTPHNTHNTPHHTHTHTCWFLWFTGTFHRRNGFYTVQTVCAIALHLLYT